MTIRSIGYLVVLRAVQKFMDAEVHEKNWLDLGCHNGTLARLLVSYGYHVTGLDVWSPKLKKESSWEYVKCDLNKDSFPFENEKFDVVSALEIIEHIIDTDKFLDGVKRVLKPRGLLVLSTPNVCMLKNRFRVVFGQYPYGLEYRNTIHHVRLYNLANLMSHLKEHNLFVLSSEGERLLPQKIIETGRFVQVSEFLARMVPTLCANLLVVARRY